MIILGIDPGSVLVGWAALEGSNGSLRLLKAQTLRLQKSALLRLGELREELQKLVGLYRPEALALERLFFAQNKKTALEVAQARGVILLTAVETGIKVYEYAPLEVKYAVTGDGRADKKQLKKMLGLVLPETRTTSGEDNLLDACAVAFTCFSKEFKGRMHT